MRIGTSCEEGVAHGFDMKCICHEYKAHGAFASCEHQSLMLGVFVVDNIDEITALNYERDFTILRLKHLPLSLKIS